MKKRERCPKGKGSASPRVFFVSGAGYPIYRSDTAHSTVVIKLNEDGGTAHVLTGSAEIGQGSDTTMAMIAAEALGVPLDHIKVSSGDTDYSVDLGAYSSRQTLMTGHATKSAAEDLKNQVLDVLGEKLKVPVDQMDIKNGFIVFKGETPDFSGIRTIYAKEHRGFFDNPGKNESLTFKEAARVAYLSRGSMVGTGSYKPGELGGEIQRRRRGHFPGLRPIGPGGGSDRGQGDRQDHHRSNDRCP